MARNDPQTNIRMPAALKAELQEAADKGGRTFGAECIYRLQKSVRLDSPANAKRDLAIKEIREAANTVVLMSEMDDRSDIEEKILRDALEDLGLWLRQLQKLDDEAERAQIAAMERFNAELKDIGETLAKGPGKAKKGFME